VNDWEEDWKILADKIGQPEEEEEKDKSDEEPDDEKGNEKKNGVVDMSGPSTTETQQTVPTT
jgi:hypothetical protein